MHDVKLVRERPDDLREAMRRRNALEHYQQPDGSVTVPAVLRTYLGSDRIG